MLHSSTPARTRPSTYSRLRSSSTTLSIPACPSMCDSSVPAGPAPMITTGTFIRVAIPLFRPTLPRLYAGLWTIWYCRPDTVERVIIDCHGHYTTTPPGVGEWRDAQVAAVGTDPSYVGEKGTVEVSDDEIRASLESAQLRVPARPRLRPHPVLATGELDGPSRRQRTHLDVLDATPERARPAGVRPLPVELRAGVPAAAVAGRGDRRLGRRTAALCHRDGVRRLQREPRPLRRVLDRAAAVGPFLVAALGGDVRTRCALP